MNKRYISPMGLPDEHMRLIGIIAAHWEYVGLVIQKAISEITVHDFDRIRLFTEGMTFESRLDLVVAYARVLETEDKAEFKELNAILEEIRAVGRLRNEYVHAAWNTADGNDPFLRAVVSTRGGRFRIEDVPTTVEELAAVAERIVTAGNRFVAFHHRFGMFQPSPNRSPEASA